jgi:hypothetical protein
VLAKDMGDGWPLTVPQGEVYCEGYRSAIFRADGVAYALNNHATNEGYANIAPILKPGRDAGPVLQMALALCD